MGAIRTLALAIHAPGTPDGRSDRIIGRVRLTRQVIVMPEPAGPSAAFGTPVSEACLVESDRSGLALSDRAISRAGQQVEENMLTH